MANLNLILDLSEDLDGGFENPAWDLFEKLIRERIPEAHLCFADGNLVNIEFDVEEVKL